MRRSSVARGAALLLVVLGGCADAIVMDDDAAVGSSGGGPTPAATVGTATSSAATGTGGEGDGGAVAGAGGGGGGNALDVPVPGCESLVWDEPLRISLRTSGSRRPALAPLANGDVCVVLAHDGHVVSTRLTQPFAAWPPAVEALVEHAEREFQGSMQELSSRPDGAFASTPDGVPTLVAHVGEPGAAIESTLGRVFLDPSAGAGGFRFAWGTPLLVDRLETLDGAWTPVGGRDVAYWTLPAVAVLDDGLLLAGDPVPMDPRGWEGPGDLELFRVDRDGIEDVGVARLSRIGYRHAAAARPGGGAWFAVSGRDWVDVLAIDDDGREVAPRFTPRQPVGCCVGHELAAWGDGFVLATVGDGPRILVSDGVRATHSDRIPLETVQTQQKLGLAVAPDARSVLVSFDAIGGVEVARARCR
jgi:hypothetical protein